MHQSTKELLDVCDGVQSLCPKKTGDAHRAYMELVNEALAEAAGLRLAVVKARQFEDDDAIVGRLEEVDQKAGAIEREARKLAAHIGVVQSILREFRSFRPRLRADLERIDRERE